jgi:hypothetical protein
LSFQRKLESIFTLIFHCHSSALTCHSSESWNPSSLLSSIVIPAP